jgi:hypothetical protein
MLSFIYRLIRNFEKEHGFTPNLLYLNQFHLEMLRTQLDRKIDGSDLAHLLDMEIIISQDAVHPHVEWHTMQGRRHAV